MCRLRGECRGPHGLIFESRVNAAQGHSLQGDRVPHTFLIEPPLEERPGYF